MEGAFLERGVKYLVPNGVLVLAVPFRVLAGLLKTLCDQFHTVRIVRGDPTFSQILVFAIRRSESDLFDQQSYRYADGVARADWGALPELSEGEWTYSVPEPVAGTYLLIRKEEVHPEYIIRALLSSDVMKSLVDSPLCRPPVEDRPFKILHPLTKGTTAMLLLAGYFDGMIFDPDDPRCSVVKGSTVFQRIRREDETDSGIEITDIDAPVSRVTVAHFESGTITDLLPESITVFGAPS